MSDPSSISSASLMSAIQFSGGGVSSIASGSSFDWHRFLIGDASSAFLLEAAIRAVIAYLILMIVMRVLGKRAAGEITRTEMGILVTFGAIVGGTIVTPERGLFPAFIVLAIAALIERGLAFWSARNRRVEKSLQGKVSLPVRNGELHLPEMKKDTFSQDCLFALLRQQGIIHLGQVERAYLETDGQLSVYRFKEARPGLSVLPAMENLPQFENYYACGHCGHIGRSEAKPAKQCKRCRHQNWMTATLAETPSA